jgi:hypothetical protein
MSREAKLCLEARTRGLLAILAAVLAISLALSEVAAAQSRPIVGRYAATTTSMTPAGVSLRFAVLEWSDDAARSAVISRLTGEATDPSLSGLPTLGYIWQSDSPVGYSIKYAHKANSGDGEVLTFVTDRPLGSYGPQPWKVEGASAATPPTDYSVVVLRLDGGGKGDGTISLGANVAFDRDANTLRLEQPAGASPLLTSAQREPQAGGVDGS